MNPLFVIAAIRAAIRIGRTAADAFEQYAQERPVLIPDVDRAETDPVLEVRRIASQNPGFKALLTDDPELRMLWQNDRPTSAPGAESAVYAVACSFEKRALGVDDHLGAQTDEERAGGMMVGQWAKGKGPVTPWARVIVAMADVSLEYVGSNPQVLGIGGNGEKLIGAIAAAIGDAIPDGETRTTLGPQDRFAERLAAAALRAGLSTLVDKPGLVFGEAHLQALIKATLPPLAAALPVGVTDQVEWRNLVDALLGPAFSAALGTVAGNTTAFFGRNFAPEKAAGIMVIGLLNAAKDTEVDKRFTHEGLLVLFQAAIGVAAANPETILGGVLGKDLTKADERSEAETVALNLFASIAGVLKDRKPPYSDELGTAIAAAAIEGLKKSGPALFNAQNPWQKTVGDMTAQILDGFAEALGDDGKDIAETAFSKDRLVDLARVFIAQVGATPYMILGDRKDEVQRVVASVAKAMAADKNLLLTADDWISIAGVAAEEAARSPGRLFGLNEKSLEGQIAADVIGRLLNAAGADLVRPDRTVGPVLVGETLRDAITVTLRAIGGNVTQAFDRRGDIETLATKLNEAVAARGMTMGGKEWLRLFRALLPGVLTRGEIPTLDDATIARLLAGGAAVPAA